MKQLFKDNENLSVLSFGDLMQRMEDDRKYIIAKIKEYVERFGAVNMDGAFDIEEVNKDGVFVYDYVESDDVFIGVKLVLERRNLFMLDLPELFAIAQKINDLYGDDWFKKVE